MARDAGKIIGESPEYEGSFIANAWAPWQADLAATAKSLLSEQLVDVFLGNAAVAELRTAQ